ncbi:MAG TPA: carbohydrate ABC transporter permease, partial [bacterium]|nr:carbohydrate ABC transporter permease [bacterium]
MAPASRRRREAWGRACAHLLLLAGAVFFAAPLLWMLSTSLKSVGQAMAQPPQWIPHPVQWGNYLDAVRYIDFFRYTANSLTVCLLSVAGTLLSSSLAAYGFSRIEWKGRDAFFLLTLSTMMIPFPTLMVPLYGVFRELHWIGTLKPLWVPACFGSAFSIFLLRQFFLGIPQEITEAA